MPRIASPVVAVAALAVVAGVAGCSSSGGGAARTPDSTPPGSTQVASSATSQPPAATHTLTGSPIKASTSSTPSASAAGAGGSACAESQLRASVTQLNLSGLNRHVLKLVFTNTSSTSCTLTGYPGAAIVDSSGKQVQQAKRVVGGPVGGTIERVATITVAPGKSLFAYLEGQSTREQGAAQAGCDAPKYPKILVTPPNTKTSVPFTTGWPQCYAFDVHPVREQ